MHLQENGHFKGEFLVLLIGVKSKFKWAQFCTHLIIFQVDEGLIFRRCENTSQGQFVCSTATILEFYLHSSATSSAPNEVFYIQQHLSLKHLLFFFPLGLQEILVILLPHKVNINSTLVECRHGHQIWILWCRIVLDLCQKSGMFKMSILL